METTVAVQSDSQWLIPAAAVRRPRVVGPGRLERGYRDRIEQLEGQLSRVGDQRARLALRLETSQRLERGCQALLDRMEARAELDRDERRSLEQRERRLVLALGALQRENELLRGQLELSSAPAPALPGRRPHARRAEHRRPATWLGRLFGSRREA